MFDQFVIIVLRNIYKKKNDQSCFNLVDNGSSIYTMYI